VKEQIANREKGSKRGRYK